MPSFFIRACRVVGGRPKSRAAPFAPLTRHPVCSNVLDDMRPFDLFECGGRDGVVWLGMEWLGEQQLLASSEAADDGVAWLGSTNQSPISNTGPESRSPLAR